MGEERNDQASCPLPVSRYDRVVLGHGGGGRLSHDLFTSVVLPRFPALAQHAREDQATLPFPREGRLVITTDAFVVRPLVFPGGDIGSLAVHGSVNDLAVGGARPLYLAAALILEEGTPITLLERVMESMRRAAEAVPIELVTGDTKVVERGKGDGIFITTTAVGVARPDLTLSATQARPGDRVLLSGSLGDHGIAILAAREGLELQTDLLSDSASLYGLVKAMLETGARIRCMRDPTRGGLSSALNEIAASSQVGIVLDEHALPIKPEVRGVCELLGLDPLYVANEGKLVAVVAAEDAERVLDTMRKHPLGREAACIGEVRADPPRRVSLRSLVGGERVVPMLAGEQLPRIC